MHAGIDEMIFHLAPRRPRSKQAHLDQIQQLRIAPRSRVPALGSQLATFPRTDWAAPSTWAAPIPLLASDTPSGELARIGEAHNCLCVGHRVPPRTKKHEIVVPECDSEAGFSGFV